MNTHCIFCTTECPPNSCAGENANLKRARKEAGGKVPVPKQHFRSILVVGQLLNISEKTLERIFLSGGRHFDPEHLVVICGNCDASVEAHEWQKYLPKWKNNSKALRASLKELVFGSKDLDVHKWNEDIAWKLLRDEMLRHYQPPAGSKNQIKADVDTSSKLVFKGGKSKRVRSPLEASAAEVASQHLPVPEGARMSFKKLQLKQRKSTELEESKAIFKIPRVELKTAEALLELSATPQNPRKEPEPVQPLQNLVTAQALLELAQTSPPKTTEKQILPEHNSERVPVIQNQQQLSAVRRMGFLHTCEHCGAIVQDLPSHSIDPFDCDFCFIAIAKQRRITKFFECKGCSAVIKMEDMASHLEDSHPGDPPPATSCVVIILDPMYLDFAVMRQEYISKYLCKRCPAFFFNEMEVKQHATFHLLRRGEYCLSCGWLVPPGKLKEHEEQHHLPQTPENKTDFPSSKLGWKRSDIRQCRICPASMRMEDLGEHANLHQSGTGVICPECGIMLKPEVLTTHKSYYHAYKECT
ncbi:unnamed protein product [Orchesella dallaii]|uniref:C2H2-type domain-containing protein n=1 Tax=Orchesella dallaii TaxID=48710 RepID=A0ABP1PXE8_9HEXA